MRLLYAPPLRSLSPPTEPRDLDPASAHSRQQSNTRGFFCCERHLLSVGSQGITIPTLYHTITRKVGPTHRPVLGGKISSYTVRTFPGKSGRVGRADGEKGLLHQHTAPGQGADRSAATNAVSCLSVFRSGLVSWPSLHRTASPARPRSSCLASRGGPRISRRWSRTSCNHTPALARRAIAARCVVVAVTAPCFYIPPREKYHVRSCWGVLRVCVRGPSSHLASWKRGAIIIVHAVPSEAGSAVRKRLLPAVRKNNDHASEHAWSR